MTCEIKHESGGAVIALSGDVDLDTSPKVRSALLDCVGLRKVVIVDMSDVSYIDSSGVASLVEAYQTARKNNTPFILAAVSEPAMRVLELARLDKIFTIFESVSDGLKSTE